jgi:hypothetical protein
VATNTNTVCDCSRLPLLSNHLCQELINILRLTIDLDIAIIHLVSQHVLLQSHTVFFSEFPDHPITFGLSLHAPLAYNGSIKKLQGLFDYDKDTASILKSYTSIGMINPKHHKYLVY